MECREDSPGLPCPAVYAWVWLRPRRWFHRPLCHRTPTTQRRSSKYRELKGVLFRSGPWEVRWRWVGALGCAHFAVRRSLELPAPRGPGRENKSTELDLDCMPTFLVLPFPVASHTRHACHQLPVRQDQGWRRGQQPPSHLMRSLSPSPLAAPLRTVTQSTRPQHSEL